MANGDDLFRVALIVRAGACAAAPPSIDTVDPSDNMVIGMLRLKTICISESGMMICSGVPIISSLQVVTYAGCPLASIQVRRCLWCRQVAWHVCGVVTVLLVVTGAVAHTGAMYCRHRTSLTLWRAVSILPPIV